MNATPATPNVYGNPSLVTPAKNGATPPNPSSSPSPFANLFGKVTKALTFGNKDNENPTNPNLTTSPTGMSSNPEEQKQTGGRRKAKVTRRRRHRRHSKHSKKSRRHSRK